MAVGKMTYRLTDGIEFLKSLPDKSVDGIFTDPPWLMSEEGNHDKKFKNSRAAKLRNADRWEFLITEMTNEGARVLNSEHGKCLIWLGMTSVGRAIQAIKSLEYRWFIVSYYIPPRYVAGFEASFDPILYYAPPGANWPSTKRNGKRIKAIYQHRSTGFRGTAHPCARPYGCVKELLNDWFLPSEYIIDPFAGSDTTGRAARELNLKWDSCEIDPKMYETGLERHKQGILFE